MSTPDVGHITLSGQGRIVHAYGDTATFLLTGKDTGGRYTLFTNVTPPGGGPPPHVHANEDESFYVLEGKVSFLSNGQWQEVLPGGSAFMPRGVPHTFKNTGETPLRMLVSASPSGFENFFIRSEEEFQRPGGPDMARLVTLAAEFGLKFLIP